MAAPTSLTLAKMKDRDLLLVLEEVCEEQDGWATAHEVAEKIGVKHKHPGQCVGSRLAWLNRFGVMDVSLEGGQQLWRVNEKGHARLHPRKFTASQEQFLDSLDEGQRLALIDKAAGDLTFCSREGIHLTRRAWQHHMGGWRDASIAPKRRRNGAAAG